MDQRAVMMKPSAHTHASGFTLIEVIISILLLGIVSATVIVLFGGLFARNSSTENAQEGALLVQSCVENITGMRMQSPSFFSTSTATLSSSCDYLPSLHNSGTGTTLSVTVSTPTSVTPPCPTSPVSCLQFVIHAQQGAVHTSPDTVLFFIQH